MCVGKKMTYEIYDICSTEKRQAKELLCQNDFEFCQQAAVVLRTGHQTQDLDTGAVCNCSGNF